MTVCLAYRANYVFHFVVLRYNFSGETSYLKGLSIRKMRNLANIKILRGTETFSAPSASTFSLVFGAVIGSVYITGLLYFFHVCPVRFVFIALCVARCVSFCATFTRNVHLFPVLPNPFLSALPKKSTSSNSISGWHF